MSGARWRRKDAGKRCLEKDLFEIILYDAAVDDKIAYYRKFAEGFNGDRIALEVFQECITGKPRNIIYDHCARAAHALKT